MSLVSSNPAPLAQQTISSAVAQYRTSPSTHAQAALDALTKLRGVGPATASLLLNVHDPENVVFFSDEAYYWLCRGGNKDAPIRYTPSEYAQLRQRAGELARRLGVGMVDVEKVAYVVVKGKSGTDTQGLMGAGKTGKRVAAAAARKDKKKAGGKDAAETKQSAPKRRTDGGGDETGLRRSKRHRA
ncbi:hypothetical protein X797_004794 [Metarhizium robertsii]|uniref:ADA HAT complex component 1 n=2 Tax=Metarhizium robertsii TaxID=568076 RepID=E9EMH2_METRA|nr:ADA HAT complex component 1 [Metarhizium robertsii ARSEF 23]EFZ03605.1 ADA HAT complex component 1 [Metarhizium robertsii ARSEF 23]EXV01961.1 hypothetical protein X797_004794 [Metarhizium robertsii]